MADSSPMLLRSGKHMVEESPTIVFAGPSTPGGTSRALSAYKREFPCDVSNTTIPYTQYRGTGVPLRELGVPGDLFIDLNPNAYRLFVRYRSWREWPGIYEETGTSEDPLGSRFTHPTDPTRVIWCTQADVSWYKITAVGLGKMRLFSSEGYRGVTFIPSHDLIRRTFIPNQVNGRRLSEDVDQPESKRRKIERSPASDSKDDVDGLHVRFEQTLDRRAGSLSSLKPLMSTSTTVSSPSGSPMSVDNDTDPDRQPMSEDLQVIIAQERYFECSTSQIIEYTQYRGYGPPPPDLGDPGDMFIDMTPEAHRLFIRYSSWVEWTGIYRAPQLFRFTHPQDRSRGVWVTHNDIRWYGGKSLWLAKKRLFSSTTASFIPAHTMIQKSGFLSQDLTPIQDRNLDDHSDDEGTQHRRTTFNSTKMQDEASVSFDHRSDDDDSEDIGGSHARQTTPITDLPWKKASPGIAESPSNSSSFAQSQADILQSIESTLFSSLSTFPLPARATSSPLSALPEDMASPTPSSPSAPSTPQLPVMTPTPLGVFNDLGDDYGLNSGDLYAMVFSPMTSRSLALAAAEPVQSNSFPENSHQSWPLDDNLPERQASLPSNTPTPTNNTLDPRTLSSPSSPTTEQLSNETPLLSSSPAPVDYEEPTTGTQASAAPHPDLRSDGHTTLDVTPPFPPPSSPVHEESPPPTDVQSALTDNEHTTISPLPSLSIPVAPEHPNGDGDTTSDTMRIKTRTRIFKTERRKAIHYTQYRGYGPPLSELGNPGDMYFDVSPPEVRLFIRYTTWREWLGVHRTQTVLFEHPEDSKSVVWCSFDDVSWYKRSSIFQSRTRLFRKRDSSFVSAHTLIQRAGILDVVLDWETLSETVTGDSGDTQPASDRSADAENSQARTLNHHRSPSRNTNALPSRNDPASPDRRPSSSSSLVPPSTSVPSPPTPPTPKPPSRGSTEIPNPLSRGRYTESPTVKGEGDVIETINEVGDMLKMQEMLEQRQERHRQRRIELSKKEADLALQEERILMDEQRAREILERTNQNTLQLQEKAKRLEDELAREKEDILAKEAEISQREKALQYRKKLIAEMEGRISEWEQL